MSFKAFRSAFAPSQHNPNSAQTMSPRTESNTMFKAHLSIVFVLFVVTLGSIFNLSPTAFAPSVACVEQADVPELEKEVTFTDVPDWLGRSLDKAADDASDDKKAAGDEETARRPGALQARRRCGGQLRQHDECLARGG